MIGLSILIGMFILVYGFGILVISNNLDCIEEELKKIRSRKE